MKISFFLWAKFLSLQSSNKVIVSGILFWPVRLGVRTPDFHSGNRGSIPLRATENTADCTQSAFFMPENPL